MDKYKLGAAGPEVSRVALGCMAMSGIYGPVDDAESICTIQEALDQGINLLDTGDFYAMGHNEMLVGRAIQGRRIEHAIPEGSVAGTRYDERQMAVLDSERAAKATS